MSNEAINIDTDIVAEAVEETTKAYSTLNSSIVRTYVSIIKKSKVIKELSSYDFLRNLDDKIEEQVNKSKKLKETINNIIPAAKKLDSVSKFGMATPAANPLTQSIGSTNPQEIVDNDEILVLGEETVKSQLDSVNESITELEKELEALNDTSSTVRVGSAYSQIGTVASVTYKDTNKEKKQELESKLSILKYNRKQLEDKYEILRIEKCMDNSDFLELTKNILTAGDIKGTDAAMGSAVTLVASNEQFFEGGESLKEWYMNNQKYLTEDQQKVITYLYNTYNSEECTKYMNRLEDQINKIKALEETEAFIEKLESNPDQADEYINNFLSTFAEGTSDGVITFFEGLKNLINESGTLSVTEYKQMFIMEALSRNEKWNKGLLFQNLSRTYNLGISLGNMAPSIVIGTGVTLATGGAGAPAAFANLGRIAAAFSLGASVAGNSYHTAKMQGADTDDAWCYGIVNALSEAGLEYAIGGIPFIGEESRSFLISIAQEGGEEFAQEMLQALEENVILGNEINMDDLLKQGEEAALCGALMGSLFHARQAFTNTANALYRGREFALNSEVRNELRERIKNRDYRGGIELLSSIEMTTTDTNTIFNQIFGNTTYNPTAGLERLLDSDNMIKIGNLSINRNYLHLIDISKYLANHDLKESQASVPGVNKLQYNLQFFAENKTKTTPNSTYKIKASNSVLNGLSKKFSESSTFEGYDGVYKAPGHINEALTEIMNNKETGKILLQIDSLSEISSDMIDKIPDNVDIRIIGGYTEDYMNGLSNPNGTESRQASTYNKEELKQIMSIVDKFEEGINSNWTDMEKAQYAYQYMVDNIKYNGQPGSTNSRTKNYDGLTSLLEKESTCIGYAFTYKELLNRMGIKCDVIGGKLNRTGKHGYNIVTIDGKSFIVDTVKTFLESSQGVNGFGVTDIENYTAKNNKELLEKVKKDSNPSIFNKNKTIIPYNLQTFAENKVTPIEQRISKLVEDFDKETWKYPNSEELDEDITNLYRLTEEIKNNDDLEKVYSKVESLIGLIRFKYGYESTVISSNSELEEAKKIIESLDTTNVSSIINDDTIDIISEYDRVSVLYDEYINNITNADFIENKYKNKYGNEGNYLAVESLKSIISNEKYRSMLSNQQVSELLVDCIKLNDGSVDVTILEKKYQSIINKIWEKSLTDSIDENGKFRFLFSNINGLFNEQVQNLLNRSEQNSCSLISSDFIATYGTLEQRIGFIYPSNSNILTASAYDLNSNVFGSGVLNKEKGTLLATPDVIEKIGKERTKEMGEDNFSSSQYNEILIDSDSKPSGILIIGYGENDLNVNYNNALELSKKLNIPLFQIDLSNYKSVLTKEDLQSIVLHSSLSYLGTDFTALSDDGTMIKGVNQVFGKYADEIINTFLTLKEKGILNKENMCNELNKIKDLVDFKEKITKPNIIIDDDIVNKFNELPDSEMDSEIKKVIDMKETDLPDGYYDLDEYKRVYARSVLAANEEKINNKVLFRLTCDPVMFSEIMDSSRVIDMLAKNIQIPAAVENIVQCMLGLSNENFQKLMNNEKILKAIDSLNNEEKTYVIRAFGYYDKKGHILYNDYLINHIINLDDENFGTFIEDISGDYKEYIKKSYEDGKKENVEKLLSRVNQYYTEELSLSDIKIKDIINSFIPYTSFSEDINEKIIGANKADNIVKELNDKIKNVERKLKERFVQTSGLNIDVNEYGECAIKIDKSGYYTLTYELNGVEYTSDFKSSSGEIIFDTFIDNYSRAIADGSLKIKSFEYNNVKSNLILTEDAGLVDGLNEVTLMVDGKEHKRIVNKATNEINLTYKFPNAKEVTLESITPLGNMNQLVDDSNALYIIKYELNGEQQQIYATPGRVSATDHTADNELNINNLIMEQNLFGARNFEVSKADISSICNLNLGLDRYSAFNEIFNKNKYGGNQSDVYTNVKKYLENGNSKKGEELVKLAKKYFPDATDMDIINLSHQYAESGCGYVAVANAFALYMENIENGSQIFKEKFGFDLYSIDEKGNKNYNIEQIVFDIYLRYAKHTIDTSLDPNMDIKTVIKKDIFGTSTFNYQFLIVDYFKEHGISLITNEHDVRNIDNVNSVKNGLYSGILNNTNGFSILQAAHFDLKYILGEENGINLDKSFKLANLDGIINDIGGHAMMITGIDENGDIEVSSWSKKYNLVPGSIVRNSNQGLMGTRVNVRTIRFEID